MSPTDSTDATGVAQRLAAAVLGGDPSELTAVLHADVAFFSPASLEPTTGAQRVAAVLATASAVYEGLRFTHELGDAVQAALFFEAEVEGRPLQGCYRLDVDGDRLVTRLDVLMRPVESAQHLVATMMRRVAAS